MNRREGTHMYMSKRANPAVVCRNPPFPENQENMAKKRNRERNSSLFWFSIITKPPFIARNAVTFHCCRTCAKARTTILLSNPGRTAPEDGLVPQIDREFLQVDNDPVSDLGVAEVGADTTALGFGGKGRLEFLLCGGRRIQG